MQQTGGGTTIMKQLSVNIAILTSLVFVAACVHTYYGYVSVVYGDYQIAISSSVLTISLFVLVALIQLINKIITCMCQLPGKIISAIFRKPTKEDGLLFGVRSLVSLYNGNTKDAQYNLNRAKYIIANNPLTTYIQQLINGQRGVPLNTLHPDIELIESHPYLHNLFTRQKIIQAYNSNDVERVVRLSRTINPKLMHSPLIILITLMSLIKQSMWEEALQYIQAIQRTNTNTVLDLQDLELMCKYHALQTKNAQALQNKPESASHHLIQMVSADHTNLPKQLIKLYKQNPSRELAITYLETATERPQQITKALELQKYNPDSKIGYIALAQAYINNEKYSEAKTQLIIADRKYPQDNTILLMLAKVSALNNDNKQEYIKWLDKMNIGDKQPKINHIIDLCKICHVDITKYLL